MPFVQLYLFAGMHNGRTFLFRTSAEVKSDPVNAWKPGKASHKGFPSADFIAVHIPSVISVRCSYIHPNTGIKLPAVVYENNSNFSIWGSDDVLSLSAVDVVHMHTDQSVCLFMAEDKSSDVFLYQLSVADTEFETMPKESNIHISFQCVHIVEIPILWLEIVVTVPWMIWT